MKYKAILTKKGESIYKGGNIEIFNKFLSLKFEAKSKIEIHKIFYMKLAEILGSSCDDYFTYKEVRQEDSRQV